MTDKSGKLTPEKAFLATTSHEIRTPLNGILGTVSLLLETPLDPAQKEYAEAIRLSGSRLLEMLNNVLDFARLDSGDLDPEPETFRVAELAREVTELLSPRAHGKGIDLGVLVRSGVPGTVVADAGKIRQILFNLVGNALKFTEQGSVVIDISQPTPGTLRFDVRDTGPGIAKPDQQRLFEAFRQASTDDARKDGGVGLGLAIVKKLTETLGGKVSLKSQPGFGASFRISLPVEIASEEQAPQRFASPCRIALAGLGPATMLSAWSAFAAAGASVHNIETAQQARHNRPDVILAAAELSERSLRALIRIAPVLVVMRPEDRGLMSRFHDMGAAGWLVRPLRNKSLIERAQLAAEGSAAPDETAEVSTGGRVLIADDNPVNTLIARRALELAGFSVSVASTGREAVDLAESLSPDLVFMDLRMPIMDGYDAMKMLRRAGMSMPVIAISAEINPEVERRARAAGADGVAAKPLDAAALRRLATDWTSRKPGAA